MNQTVTEIYSEWYLKERFDLQNGVIVDVRSEKERSKMYIHSSKHIDLLSQNFGEYFSEMDKKKSILIYCNDGSRSKAAIRILREMGFSNLFHLVDGLIQWDGEVLYPPA